MGETVLSGANSPQSDDFLDRLLSLSQRYLDAELPEQNQTVPDRPQLSDFIALKPREISHGYRDFPARWLNPEKHSCVLDPMDDAVRGVIAVDHQMVYPHVMIAEGIKESPGQFAVIVVTHHVTKH